ncbi:hypothetical protein J28TS4_53130 [Paenibacillus lautus]|nr:hypothetical protein J28TS4_53130 [Paenibacillus lautus]
MTCSPLPVRTVRGPGHARMAVDHHKKRAPGNSTRDSSHFLIDAGIENGNVPFPLLGNSHADKEQLYVR